MSTNDRSNDDQQQQLDDILDAALDELDGDVAQEEEEEEESYATPPEDNFSSSPRQEEEDDAKKLREVTNNNSAEEEEAAAMLESLESMLKQLQTDFSSTDEAAIRTAAAAADKSPSSKNEPPQKFTTTESLPTASTSNDVNSTIESLLENMSQTQPDEIPENEQAMLENLMKEFENFLPPTSSSSSSNDPTDALVNGMMQQLLSKELMYEPMVQVCQKFPPWLARNRDEMSSEEYKRRCNQLECFQQLVHVYETEPDNVEKLMVLMERVQEYGQPPMEIVQEIAPGLELDEDGMPKDGGIMGNEGDCSIM